MHSASNGWLLVCDWAGASDVTCTMHTWTPASLQTLQQAPPNPLHAQRGVLGSDYTPRPYIKSGSSKAAGAVLMVALRCVLVLLLLLHCATWLSECYILLKPSPAAAVGCLHAGCWLSPVAHTMRLLSSAAPAAAGATWYVRCRPREHSTAGDDRTMPAAMAFPGGCSRQEATRGWCIPQMCDLDRPLPPTSCLITAAGCWSGNCIHRSTTNAEFAA
jgi:hypothetical protein